MKSFKVAFMSVVAVAVLAGSSFAATWKLATIRPEGSPVDVEVRRLAAEVVSLEIAFADEAVLDDEAVGIPECPGGAE